MTYAKAFFGLQLEFAEAVSGLSGLPLARAVLDYTNLYIRVGLGRDFEPNHPTWQDYAAGLLGAHDRADFTYSFYLARPETVVPPGVVATFGCFSSALLSADRIRLHFRNVENAGQSALAMQHRDRRLVDLAELFAHVKYSLRGPVRVVGASWLYNIVAYRRLFPEAYLATARVIQARFRHMPLWGQFLDRHGNVRENMALAFRKRLHQQSSVLGLDGCFSFQVLSLEAPALEFYDFYGV